MKVIPDGTPLVFDKNLLYENYYLWNLSEVSLITGMSL